MLACHRQSPTWQIVDEIGISDMAGVTHHRGQVLGGSVKVLTMTTGVHMIRTDQTRCLSIIENVRSKEGLLQTTGLKEQLQNHERIVNLSREVIINGSLRTIR